MAKLFAVLISSLRLFQSRLSLSFNEFVPNLCDLAGGSSQSILIIYILLFIILPSSAFSKKRLKLVFVINASVVGRGLFTNDSVILNI